MSIRVLIVDDHGIVRQGLRMYLGVAPDIEVVGEASNGRQALQAVGELKPDVVLMDLMMPEMDGIEATEAIRKAYPSVEVVALTSVLEDKIVVDAVKAGAIGYLLKDTQADQLCSAIRAAAAGQVQIAPEAAVYLMRQVRAPQPTEALTEREADVLRLLARGHSNKQIAAELIIGDTTVKTHVSNVLAKLGVTSRTQAALQAMKLGLVPGVDA
jgi:DNA-binding NarL/FixJ family response regulator